jgi:hypothetical protein
MSNLKEFFQATFEEKLVKYVSLLPLPLTRLLLSSFLIACRQLQEQPQQYLTPATKLLEKRREMTEVDTALLTQKEVPNIP